jgi:hypothetical protein
VIYLNKLGMSPTEDEAEKPAIAIDKFGLALLDHVQSNYSDLNVATAGKRSVRVSLHVLAVDAKLIKCFVTVMSSVGER